MTNQVSIREYTAADRGGVLALFRRHFGAWSAQRWEQRWEWEFYQPRGCSERQSCIWVAEADGAIVGQIAAFPLPFRIGEERFEALCPVGFAVDEGHRWAAFRLLRRLLAECGLILGTGWTEAAAKLFRSRGAMGLALSEVRYVYPLRHIGATQRELRQRLPASLRWMGNRRLAALAAPLLDRRRGRTKKRLPHLARGGNLRPISRFGEEYDGLWKSAAGQFRVSLDKDSAYLNWRYIDCPTTSPLCLGCYDEDDSLSGVVVACRRVHMDVAGCPCGEDGEILELILREPHPESARQLLIPAMEWLNARGVDAVAATGLSVALHPVLEELGFVRTSCTWGDLLLLSRIPEHPAAEILEEDQWYFTSGDGDHLFRQGL